MSDLIKHALATFVGIALAGIDAAYMLYLRVPSVLKVRPELADVGLVAGLFGGRPAVYLFHNYTIPIVILNVVLFVLIFNLYATSIRN